MVTVMMLDVAFVTRGMRRVVPRDFVVDEEGGEAEAGGEGGRGKGGGAGLGRTGAVLTIGL